jgi:hypothetical protein
MTAEWIDLGDPNSPRLLSRADQRWTARLEDVEQTLAALRHVAPAALGRLRDHLAGQPGAASYDGPGSVSGQSHPDPTGQAALTVDRAAADRAQLDKDLAALRNAAGAIQAMVLRYGTGRTSPTRQRRHTDRYGDPGCQSCARMTGHEPGTQRWEPVHRTSTVSDNLTAPMALCAWCYGFVRDIGRLPNRVELTAHHQGRKVTRVG